MKRMILIMCLLLVVLGCQTAPKCVILQESDHLTVMYADNVEQIIIIDLDGNKRIVPVESAVQ